MTQFRRGDRTLGSRPIVITVVLFLILFLAIRHIHPAGIVFYQGMFLGLLLSIAQYTFQRRSAQSAQPAKDALLSFLLIYAFVFTIPTTVDRAYSVRMLSRLGDAPNGLSRAEITTVFLNGFIADGGVEKRLAEQTKTGSIREQNGRFILTPEGRLLARTFKVARIVFACQGKE